MKKLVLSVAILMGAWHPSMAGEGDKVKVVTNDTTSSNVLFNVQTSNSDNLVVDVHGVLGDMPSISLIDRKGETKYFTFLNAPTTHVEIDLTDVQPGMYYVKLNMDSEIRMKLVVIEAK